MPNTRRWTRRPEGSNWGDFGMEDQVGRLNLITPEERRAAGLDQLTPEQQTVVDQALRLASLVQEEGIKKLQQYENQQIPRAEGAGDDL